MKAYSLYYFALKKIPNFVLTFKNLDYFVLATQFAVMSSVFLLINANLIFIPLL